MLRRSTALLALTLAAGVFCAMGQDAGEPIKVETRLVSVPVIVSDRNGRYVPNLTAADFTLTQDGVPQQIEFFAATEEALTIALLIDTSQSTRPVLNDINDSARSFINLLRARDRAMIVSFDHDPHVLSPLTSDHEQLRNAIRNAEIPDYFGTTLRDALYGTISRSFAGIKGRKAVIVLTDGKDAGSRISERALLYALEETDTLIYTVMFKTGGFARFNRRGGDVFAGNARRTQRIERVNREAEQFLKDLSDTTAGRFYTSEDGKLKKTFATIVDELRFQYRLGFYPPEETGRNALHEIKVKVRRPDSVVRARGYYRTTSK